MTNPAAGDLFPGSASMSVLGALAAWGLAFLLGAALIGRRRDESLGENALAWGVLGIALSSQLWLFLGFAGAIGPRSVPLVALAAAALAAPLAWWRLRGGDAPEPARPDVALAARGTIGAALSAEALARTRRREGERPWRDPLFLASAALLALFVLAVARFAFWPTIFYDDLVYHLGAPRQALLTGTWPALPGMHYTFMPAGWDAAYLLPLALGGGTGPQLMNTIALALLGVAIYRLARHVAGPGPSAAMTALLLVAPMTGQLGAFAGNDLFVALALTVALERLVATRGERPWLVGLIAGAAWATKYPSLPAIVALGLAAALLREGGAKRRVGALAAVGFGAVAVALVWNIRAFVLTGNPLYPAFHGLLGGEPWNELSDSLVANQIAHGGFGDRGFSAFYMALVDLLTRSQTLGYPAGINALVAFTGLSGVVFALVFRRSRLIVVLALVFALSYAGWVLSSLNLRYGLFVLALFVPFAALLFEAGLRRLGRMVQPGLVALLAVTLVVALALGPGLALFERQRAIYQLDERPFGPIAEERSEMLDARRWLAGVSRWVAANTPPDARLLLVGDGCFAHLPRPALASSAYDRPDLARLVEGATSVAELSARLPGTTHVLINFGELERFREKYRYAEWFSDEEWALVGRWVSEGLEMLHREGPVAVYRVRPPEELP